MSKKVTVYTSEVSGNRHVVPQKNKIIQVLTSFRADFEVVDISVDEQAKAYMHAHSGASNPLAIPQVFVNGEYLGDYDSFDMLNEDGLLKAQVA
jgi:glutaredoxin-related protein